MPWSRNFRNSAPCSGLLREEVSEHVSRWTVLLHRHLVGGNTVGYKEVSDADMLLPRTAQSMTMFLQ
jgi:hypothetical protein